MKRQTKGISVRALLCASVFGAALPTAASAQDITIDTATTDRVNPDAGQTVTITETGSITTAGRVIGVPTTGTGTVTVVNRGRIESTSTTTLTSTIGPASTINLNLTNEAGGSITGARPVYFTTGELINRGTIASTMTGTSTADAINAVQDSIVRLEAGSVTSASSATTGNSYAVNFTGGGNSIYIDTGATVNGTIRAATDGVGANRVYLTGTGAQTLGSITGFDGFTVKSGVWTVTSSIGASAEGSVIEAGATLRWGDGGASGSVSGDIVNDGQLIINRTNQVLAFTTASITGTGQLIIESPGATGGLTLRASGTSYSGDTIVRSGSFSASVANAMSANSGVILESMGTLDIVAGADQEIGGLSGMGATNINGAALTLGGTDLSTTYTGAFAGDGSLVKTGAGTLTYGGTGALGGGVTVRGGGLLLDGSLTSDVLVEAGASLGGTGTLAGNAVVNGTLAGQSGQTLTLQSLALGAGSTVAASLGSNGAPVLFDVLGDLTLDGALAVTPATDFGAGLYRIFSYGGTLTDNGLDVGPLSGGASGALQTSTAGEVNLVVSTGSTVSDIQFWNGTKTAGDGTIAGGDGVWSADGRTNWTDLDGASSETWGGRFAVFDGPAGTVTIDDTAGAIAPSGIQFASNGYRVEGDPLTLTGAVDVRVGDGSAGGAATTATIASNITGSGSLTKQDLGTLILTGANDQAGGTRIAAGTLQLAAGGSLDTTGAVPAVGIVASAPAATVTLVNVGRISASDRAIDAAAGTTLSLINENGGTIEGASGVYLDAGEVINRGSITASNGDAIRAAAGATVRLEAGSTTAFTGSDAGYAVNFTGGSNNLYIDSGATVTGQIRGASAAGSGPDRVYLTGAGSAILPSMTNFEGYYFRSGDWTVTASFLATAEGSTIDEGATLRWGNGGTTGSVSGQITNNGRLFVNRTNQVVAFTTAPITGTGQLIIDSPGAAGGLTLRAPGTTYSGDTIVRSGTFRGGAAGALSANSQVVLEDAGVLDIIAGFDQEIGGLSGVGATNINGAALTLGGTGLSTSYTGAFAGDGTLIKTGAGTLTYGGTGTLGGVTVRGGGLLLDGSLTSDVLVEAGASLGGAGTLAGNAVVDGTLTGQSGRTLTLQSLELGAGSTVAATLGSEAAPALFDVLGDLTLDGALAVTPDTGFGAGLYRIFAYGGALTDNGLDVGPLDGGVAGTVQTSISGQVNLVVDDGSGPSAIQFWNGAKTAGDGTIAGGDGIWSAGSNSNWTSSDGTSSEAWGGRFAVFGGTPGIITIDDAAGAVSATGIQFASTGYRVEGDPLTLAGAIDVRVGDGTAEGAATTATIASSITGTGSLAKQDLGTLILTGANDYAGGTRVLAGILQIGAGGDSGSLPGDVLIGGGALVFDRSDDVGYGGTITGSGQLRQQGAGVLTLTADSSAFTGTTTVAVGQLRVDGALGGTAVAAAGGLLGGTGRLGDIVVRSGGTLAPGNSIGLLTARSATFDTGSVFAVEVNPDGAADLLRTTGQVTIDGGTVQVLAGAGDYSITSDYTLIEAAGGVVLGGPSNGFEGVTTNLAFLTPTLGYSANAVTLNLTRNDTDFTDVAATANQSSVAAAIQSAGLGSELYDAVLYLDGAGARNAFDLASGEIHASVRTAMVEDLRRPRAAVMQRLGTAPEGLGMWLQGYGGRGDNRDRPNAARIERQSNGILGGIDVGDAGLRGGLAVGYNSNDLDSAARASSGSAKSLQLMAYGGARLAGLRLSLGAGYSDVDVDTERAPAFGGLSGQYKASYGGSVLHGFADLGLPLALGGGSVEPFAGIAHIQARTKAFTETGAGPLALAGDRGKDRFTLSTLGLRAETSATGPLAVRASAAWQHGFGDIAPVSLLRFADASATPFRVAGAAIARDAAIVDLDVMWRLTDKMRFSLGYSGQLGANVQDHAGMVSLGFVF